MRSRHLALPIATFPLNKNMKKVSLILFIKNNLHSSIFLVVFFEFDPLRTGILLCDKEKLYFKLQTLKKIRNKKYLNIFYSLFFIYLKDFNIRTVGFEPTPSAWKTPSLPLTYARERK